MKNIIKYYIECKSRFYFNINFSFILKKSFKYFFYKKFDFRNILEKKLHYYFPKSNFFFFNHGRSGFYFVLKKLKNQHRKKVLINSLTLFEMINMIIYCDYEPIFIDNKKNSFETNTVKLIDKHIDDLGFVVITHLNGLNKEIFEIKKKIDHINKNRPIEKKIYLIEDAAVSFGAKYNDIFCGSIGDFSILSFNIMKNITSFTGGALIDNQKILRKDLFKDILKKITLIDLIKKISFFSILEILNSKLIFPFFYLFIKFAHKKNYNFFLKKYRTDFKTHIYNKIPDDFLKSMSNYQMYLLIDQLDEVAIKNKIRINNSYYYYEKLKNHKDLIFPQTNFNEENIFLDFPIICKNKKTKDTLFLKSLEKNIDIKNYYYKNCETEEIYSKYNKNNSINSKIISDNILMLPNNIKYNKKDLEKIVSIFY